MSGSPFKNQVAADIGAVFFSDQEEFWSEHTINGTPMRVHIDNDELIRRSAPKVYSAAEAKLYKGNWLILVQASEYGEKPAIGALITFDGKPRRVMDVDDQSGVYLIELEALRS